MDLKGTTVLSFSLYFGVELTQLSHRFSGILFTSINHSMINCVIYLNDFSISIPVHFSTVFCQTDYLYLTLEMITELAKLLSHLFFFAWQFCRLPKGKFLDSSRWKCETTPECTLNVKVTLRIFFSLVALVENVFWYRN